MNEFKSVPGLSSSAPLNMNGDIHSKGLDDSAKLRSSGICYISCCMFDIENVRDSPHSRKHDINGCSINVRRFIFKS